LTSCDLLADNGSGLEKIWLRDIRGEKEAEPFPSSTRNRVLELIFVQIVSSDKGSPSLDLGFRAVEFVRSKVPRINRIDDLILPLGQ
jgi:hypothetical protein